MSETDVREPFYNKIFFCDVVGFSRLDPIGQFACQRALTRALTEALATLGTALEEDVIALPTGDGMVLNFISPSPDMHLRAALLVLERLYEGSSAEQSSFTMRIGLNSHVDSWVYDINGKRNVVGSGINMAQRVMDLADRGQLLMHDRVRSDLESFPAYEGKLVAVGSFKVKHGVKLPVAQYVDPDQPFLSQTLAEPAPLKPAAEFDFADVLRNQARETILSLTLDGDAKGSITLAEDFIEDFLDGLHAYQSLKVSAAWIASELLANAFAHSRLNSGDKLKLVMEKTNHGLFIAVEQPDVPSFDLGAILQDPAKTDSFMQLMKRRGLRWSAPRAAGRLSLGLELPDDFALAPRAVPDFAIDATSVDLPASVAAFLDGAVDRSACGRIALVAPDFPRVDETTWEEFQRFLDGEIALAAAPILILDLRRVGYLSSRGLRCLTVASRAAQAKGMKIVLTGADQRMREILAISRYDKIFDCYQTSEDAYRALARNA